MNPLFEGKLFLTRYVVFYTIFSAAYAVVFGWQAGLPAEYAAIDGAVFGVVSGLEGLGLWSVLKYGTGSRGQNGLRVVFYFTVGILFAIVAIGLETAVMSALPAETFHGFVRTIPARSLLLVLEFALFALYYAYAGRSDDDGDLEPAKPEPAGAGAIERIAIRGGQKIKMIAVTEIIYLQAEGDYVAVVTAEGRFLKEQTMKYFEENLPGAAFVRVHRSYIVSVSHISRIEQSGREHSVILRDGTRVRISDGGYKLLRATLGL